VAITLVRELGPTRRADGGWTQCIGNGQRTRVEKVTEQIDAMRALGTDLSETGYAACHFDGGCAALLVIIADFMGMVAASISYFVLNLTRSILAQRGLA
jgi:hypothetical protein